MYSTQSLKKPPAKNKTGALNKNSFRQFLADMPVNIFAALSGGEFNLY
jgi:hypothetical protein